MRKPKGGTLKHFDYPVGFVFIGLVLVCFMAGYFVGVDDISGFFKSLFSSLFASYVFLFLTVTLKEQADKRKIKKITSPMLERIINSYESSIHNSVLFPNPKCRPMPEVSSLSISDLEELIDFDLLNTELKGFRSYYPEFSVQPKTYIDQLIVDTTLPVDAALQDIKPYFYLLNHDIIDALTKIENSMYFKFSGSRLKHRSEFVFDKDIFIENYKNILELGKVINKVL